MNTVHNTQFVAIFVQATPYVPTVPELTAARAFAKKHGHFWKNRLRIGWERGDLRAKGLSFRHAVILKQFRDTPSNHAFSEWLMCLPAVLDYDHDGHH